MKIQIVSSRSTVCPQKKQSQLLFKPPLAIARVANWIASVRLFVCLSVAKMQKTRFSQKTKQFRAMVSIDDL